MADKTVIKWGIGTQGGKLFNFVLFGGLYDTRSAACQEGYSIARTMGKSWSKLRDEGWGVFAYAVRVSMDRRYTTIVEARKNHPCEGLVE